MPAKKQGKLYVVTLPNDLAEIFTTVGQFNSHSEPFELPDDEAELWLEREAIKEYVPDAEDSE